MSAADLSKVNAFRALQQPPRPPLTESPGFRVLKYGKEKNKQGHSTGKQGSWDNEKMVEQTIDVMDCVDVLHPGHQAQMSFDWSSGHSARSDDGLAVGGMNNGYGGKQRKLRDTVLTAEMIGPYPTTVTVAGVLSHPLLL